MDHPVCDFAHHMTKVALAHTGIWLSDGATNTMPIGPHRGDNLQRTDAGEYRGGTSCLAQGLRSYPSLALEWFLPGGWDLNPAQFPMRYAAVFAFFLELRRCG